MVIIYMDQINYDINKVVIELVKQQLINKGGGNFQQI